MGATDHNLTLLRNRHRDESQHHQQFVSPNPAFWQCWSGSLASERLRLSVLEKRGNFSYVVAEALGHQNRKGFPAAATPVEYAPPRIASTAVLAAWDGSTSV
jgi:hypothetical protein